jgi:hypothetical protein
LFKNLALVDSNLAAAFQYGWERSRTMGSANDTEGFLKIVKLYIFLLSK